MTPPVVPQSEQLKRPSAAVAAVRATSPAFRYLLAGGLMLFAMTLATILVWYKQPITWVDAALVLPALVLGFALAAPGTFALVVGQLKPLLPTFGRRDP